MLYRMNAGLSNHFTCTITGCGNSEEGGQNYPSFLTVLPTPSAGPFSVLYPNPSIYAHPSHYPTLSPSFN